MSEALLFISYLLVSTYGVYRVVLFVASFEEEHKAAFNASADEASREGRP